MTRAPPISTPTDTLFPYTSRVRLVPRVIDRHGDSRRDDAQRRLGEAKRNRARSPRAGRHLITYRSMRIRALADTAVKTAMPHGQQLGSQDRKSTRLNSSH